MTIQIYFEKHKQFAFLLAPIVALSSLKHIVHIQKQLSMIFSVIEPLNYIFNWVIYVFEPLYLLLPTLCLFELWKEPLWDYQETCAHLTRWFWMQLNISCTDMCCDMWHEVMRSFMVLLPSVKSWVTDQILDRLTQLPFWLMALTLQPQRHPDRSHVFSPGPSGATRSHCVGRCWNVLQFR